MTDNEPMTNERLAEIRAQVETARAVRTFWSGMYAWDVSRLLDEIERLQAENTEHREHISSLISQLSDCESKRDADLEQRIALERQIAKMRPIVAEVAEPFIDASNGRQYTHVYRRLSVVVIEQAQAFVKEASDGE